MSSSRTALPSLFVALVALLACDGLRTLPEPLPDAGTGDGGHAPEDSGMDASFLPDAATPLVDAGPPPQGACQPMPLPCLDHTRPEVIEVGVEGSLPEAFTNAKASDVVQVRGLSVPAGHWVPPYVTFRGCEGARIPSTLYFKGTSGIVEGFEIAGSITASATGHYEVRQNRFVAGGSAVAGVSGTSIEALVGSTVNLTVEGNWFESRPRGIEAITRYDTLTHRVDLTVRNNIFTGVTEPVIVNEAGLVGEIAAKVEHNTFHRFDDAIALRAVVGVSSVSGNIFVEGSTAVTGGSPYQVSDSLAWKVTTPAGTPPLSGAFANGDPAFLDADAGRFELGEGLLAVDRIANGAQVPSADYHGCPRPAGPPGSAPASDLGALEARW